MGLLGTCVLLAVLIVFEKSSSANYYHDSYSEVGTILGDFPAELSNARKIAWSQFSGSKKTESNTKADGMIPFITGLIVVYLPETENAGELAREIVHIGTKEGVDPLYIAAIISVESRFLINAKSKVGAMGLMQLMPRTADEMIQKGTVKTPNSKLTDPKTNILLGVTYIKKLEKKYKKNRRLALAAYNWGLGNVDKVLKEEEVIPASVEKYAYTIMTRTTRWNKHYKEANKSEKVLLASAR